MENESESQGCSGCQGINWWATLVVAVIAVPSFGAVVVALSGVKGFASLAVFVLACWLCTYLGMKLMHNPKMSQKLDLHRKP
ncbi:MAG: hypothetical protein KGJ06_07975 [Pseudomonadota bacterium]|nr:hypothetical protein [Pseudomonadota bacterium]